MTVVKRFLAALASVLVVACGSASPGPAGTPLSVAELKFKVIDTVGTPVYCDPDFYPIAREGGEQANAISQYPMIRAQTDLYAVLTAHEHLPSGELTDAQKLTLYRAYKRLNALTFTQDGNEYAFEFRASKDQGAIQMIKGTVRVDGVVTVSSTTPTGPPNCPICLAASTLIGTPVGPVRVIDIRPGMLVRTTTLD